VSITLALSNVAENSIFGSPIKIKWREAAPFICIRRYICNGRPYTPSHNVSDALCMLRTLLTIRKITVGKSVSRAPSVSPRTSEYVYESQRESSHLRESESTRARKRFDQVDWVVAGGSYFYRHAALCSAERIAECIVDRLYASMRPKIRFLLSQSCWKLIGRHENCALR